MRLLSVLETISLIVEQQCSLDPGLAVPVCQLTYLPCMHNGAGRCKLIPSTSEEEAPVTSTLTVVSSFIAGSVTMVKLQNAHGMDDPPLNAISSYIFQRKINHFLQLPLNLLYFLQ